MKLKYLIIGINPAKGQNFVSYENLRDDFNCNINGVLQGEWYSRYEKLKTLR